MRIRTFFLGLIILLLTSQSAFSQAPTSTPQSAPAQGAIAPALQLKLGGPQIGVRPSENYTIYRFFFRHLANLDVAAAQAQSLGKDGSGLRTHDQRMAKLTDQEGLTLKQIAYDCNDAMKQLDLKLDAIVAAGHALHPNGEWVHYPPPPELYQLEAERIQVINAHIDQLKSQLGEASFQKLDIWVQSRYRSVVHSSGTPVAPLAPAGSVGTSAAGERP